MSNDHTTGTTNGALVDHSENRPAREAITQGEHAQMDLPKVSGAVGVLIGVVVLVLLGAAVLPRLGASLAQAGRATDRCERNNGRPRPPWM